ncbi:MAG: tetratricopeptide repeat protein [Bacteroidales bacterium]|nr:tetratricopeptide repeat protein [Bacteroidales bacterium]MBQ4196806.1 tetratricopeptide repeat protein [Bacteroidales bacterium]
MEDKKKILGQIISAVEIEALMREGKNEEAHSSLSNLLKKEPKNSYAWYLLGNLYSRQQLYREALEAYNNAKLLEPDGPAAAAVDWVVEQMSASDGL